MLFATLRVLRFDNRVFVLLFSLTNGGELAELRGVHELKLAEPQGVVTAEVPGEDAVEELPLRSLGIKAEGQLALSFNEVDETITSPTLSLLWKHNKGPPLHGSPSDEIYRFKFVSHKGYDYWGITRDNEFRFKDGDDKELMTNLREGTWKSANRNQRANSTATGKASCCFPKARRSWWRRR
jgi:hypothetical protein